MARRGRWISDESATSHSVEFVLGTIFARERVPSSDGEGPGWTPESLGAARIDGTAPPQIDMVLWGGSSAP